MKTLEWLERSGIHFVSFSRNNIKTQHEIQKDKFSIHPHRVSTSQVSQLLVCEFKLNIDYNIPLCPIQVENRGLIIVIVVFIDHLSEATIFEWMPATPTLDTVTVDGNANEQHDYDVNTCAPRIFYVNDSFFLADGNTPIPK